jgi:hypothetical protein
MDTLLIFGIIVLVVISLVSKPKGNVASWDNVEKREQDIQRTREKLTYWGFPTVL